MFGFEKKGFYRKELWNFMTKDEVRKSLKIDSSQREVVEAVIKERYFSVDSFKKRLSEVAGERKYSNYYMFEHNLVKYLSGKMAVTVNLARAILEALFYDSRLGFLREIAEQKLRTD